MMLKSLIFMYICLSVIFWQIVNKNTNFCIKNLTFKQKRLTLIVVFFLFAGLPINLFFFFKLIIIKNYTFEFLLLFIVFNIVSVVVYTISFVPFYLKKSVFFITKKSLLFFYFLIFLLLFLVFFLLC